MTEVTKYITYDRVSTKGQGESGLGLAAQERDRSIYFDNFVSEPYEIIKGFTDTTSAKGMLDTRPVLREAVELAKQTGAIILVAKLDRLSRDVELIAHLMKHIKFKVACMPFADEFQLHLYAALAEQERKFISARTKAGLAMSTKKLGGYRPSTQARNTVKQTASVLKAKEYKDLLVHLRVNNNMTWQKVADTMNASGCKTPQGGKIFANTAKRYFDYVN